VPQGLRKFGYFLASGGIVGKKPRLDGTPRIA